MQGFALCVLFQQQLALVSPLFLCPERRKCTHGRLDGNFIDRSVRGKLCFVHFSFWFVRDARVHRSNPVNVQIRKMRSVGVKWLACHALGSMGRLGLQLPLQLSPPARGWCVCPARVPAAVPHTGHSGCQPPAKCGSDFVGLHVRRPHTPSEPPAKTQLKYSSWGRNSWHEERWAVSVAECKSPNRWVWIDSLTKLSDWASDSKCFLWNMDTRKIVFFNNFNLLWSFLGFAGPESLQMTGRAKQNPLS